MRQARSTARRAAARTPLVGLVLIAILGISAAAAALARVSVRPGTGGPETRFEIRFQAPERTGRVGAIRRTDRLYVTGPRGSGCVASVYRALPPVKRGAHVRLSVAPARGARWCTGRFRARIVRTESAACTATCVAPKSPGPHTIARFSFRVRTRAGSPAPTPTPTPTPGTGPTFAGIKSATLCTGGAPKAVPPPSRTYTVSWDAATDPSTPSDKIVYDIYYSSLAGGQNFSSALATTGSGQTSYSGTLAGSGSAYFVVRARDSAGHEDANTVEKQAVNTC
jgi:hypothetical protein